jgi:outer membrane protein
VNNKVALKDVLLSSEYEVDKINEQLLSAQKNARVAKAYFNFLLNQDFKRDIKIDSVFIKESPIVPSLLVLNQSAFDKRPEFEQLESGLRINNRLLTLQEKNAKSPSVYLGGNTGFQGFGYSFTNQAYLVAQVGLQWDIFHGNEKKHKIQQTKISKSILDTKIEDAKNQVSFQVNQNYEEVKNAMDGYLITQKGSIKTEKILEIVNSRYKNGQALFIEVTKAQSDDITAKLSTNISKYNMWLKWAGLKKVSGI